MKDNSRAGVSIRISLTTTQDVFERFCLLTGSGFTIHMRLGCTVRELLSGQLGVDPEYLDERIQTIFLNGQVVDDPETATVPSGSTLALSAALPGIAGAMLRKKSRYASMRSQLSHSARTTDPGPDVEGDVVIKLFNMLQRELGLKLLPQGIRVPGRAFRDLLQHRWQAFRAGILTAEVSGEPVSPSILLGTNWTDSEVFLVVRCQASETD